MPKFHTLIIIQDQLRGSGMNLIPCMCVILCVCEIACVRACVRTYISLNTYKLFQKKHCLKKMCCKYDFGKLYQDIKILIFILIFLIFFLNPYFNITYFHN